MKLAIVTTIGPEALTNLTFPTMREYADRIGAEFVIVNESYMPLPGLEKFQIFNLLNKYHRIIWLDPNVIVRDDCPNLFDVVGKEEIGLFNAARFDDCKSLLVDAIKDSGINIEMPEKNFSFYDTGVFVVSRIHKFIFAQPKNETKYSEGLLNVRILKEKDNLKIKELEYKLNRMQGIDRITGEHRRASYIIHYKNVPEDILLNILQSDLKSWQETSPEHQYKRKILVKTHGGLGDEICAEPIIRYMVEKAYADSEITVATWFPRLFEHLPVKVVGINGFKPDFDTPYYLMETLVSPEHLAWQFMSANLMNATDFMSQSCLRMILPDDYKSINLKVKMEDISEVIDVIGVRAFSELILVHPGKGWDSKTFPKEYWDKIIKGLVDAGLQVVVIGKDLSDEQGTVQVDIPKGVIDARNLLTLGGLMGLISQAKVLISNDSSPVHIAGAFDNWILLIPTCKHPDHVLPFRNGSKYHKAISLAKRLMFYAVDSTPTKVHGQTIDKIPGDIYDFLPEPNDVVEAALRAYKS